MEMCKRAVEDSDWINVDGWEAAKDEYQRTVVTTHLKPGLTRMLGRTRTQTHDTHTARTHARTHARTANSRGPTPKLVAAVGRVVSPLVLNFFVSLLGQGGAAVL
jgi:hypothetical protein